MNLARWLFVLILLCGCARLSLAEAPTLEATIAEEMEFPYWDAANAEKRVQGWGADAVPILIRYLRETKAPRTKGKAAAYLGFTRAPEAVPALIEVLTPTRKDPSDASISLESNLDAVLNSPSEERTIQMFVFHALATIGNTEALAFLSEKLLDPKTAEYALGALAYYPSPESLAIVRKAVEKGLPLQPGLVQDHLQNMTRKLARKLSLEEAAGRTPSRNEGWQAFWQHQTVPPDPDLARDIVGIYQGVLYSSDTMAHTPMKPVSGLRFEFRADGTCRTNFPFLLQNLESFPRILPEPGETQTTWRYRVLGPTQLVLAPGDPVTSFAVKYRDGHLAFHHRRLNTYVSLAKQDAKPAPSFTADDFIGRYVGTADLAEGETQLKRVEGVGLTFGRNGYFDTNFGSIPGKIFLGFNTADGLYALDPAGWLVLSLMINGGDFEGAETTAFFDWHLDGNANLHVNNFHMAYYGAALVFPAPGNRVLSGNEEVRQRLTQGAYEGSAYRASVDGNIEEITGIRLTFRPDGTYTSNFPEKLRQDEQYYPEAEGVYVVLSNRQLYMARRWQGNHITNAGITDCLISEDRLWFTSLEDKAYLVLHQK